MNNFINGKKHTRPFVGGFSIIELIIAVSIFIVLTTTFLFNYNSFNKHVTLDTLAHQIAQWVRDAQVSAMSVKRSSTTLAPFPGYGLHFDMSTPNKFIYFADIGNGAGGAPNKAYDPPVPPAQCGDVGEECVKEILLLQGNTVYSLCGEVSAPASPSLTALCDTFGTSQVFDLVFTRPNPDAAISGDQSGVGFPVAYDRARITITSPFGYKRVVEVWTTGQITVQ